MSKIKFAQEDQYQAYGGKYQLNEDKFLRDNCLEIPAKRMSEILGRSENSARQRMKLLGIAVPVETIEGFKNESRFKKGREPENKGKKQSEYMTQEAIEATKATRFKPGQLPSNTKPSNGVITVRTDKRTGIKYQYIRLEIGKWKELHRYKWEKEVGKISKGMCVVFRDGNSMNCDVSNLELITRRENMKRNTIHNYPKEIALAVQLRGVLNRQINKRKKKLHEK